MPAVQENTVHPVRTARRGLSYVFTPKHHGASLEHACWLNELSFNEEFAIFSRADGIVVEHLYEDNRQIADENGNLYGYQSLPDGSLLVIGTWHQQLAEFPLQGDGVDWHGYPIWAISNLAPLNYRGEKCRPAKEVFDRMFGIGDITRGQRKRLKKGDWI